MKPNLTTVFKPKLVETNNNQEQIKNLQQGVANLSPKIEDNREADFLQSIKNAINEVSDNQTKSAELAKKYELGIENDLTKVMMNQQMASLGFQMTLNIRNKVLSAYKDIMNMPV
ncbi:MAG: flagellar hook-basal body complex protein FliE [Rickettsiales bacterium]|jgi:flagellar hook-basal body complex protein FliE|nr:flagellar hook-basal body complex protein FliE [Rickettsiales bacterium]|tara:strand:- start:337 stop:681 length:345 start_codon:yes stop_codon:yes gene_type:complete